MHTSAISEHPEAAQSFIPRAKAFPGSIAACTFDVGIVLCLPGTNCPVGEGVDTGEGLILQLGSRSKGALVPHILGSSSGGLLVPTRSQHSVKEVLKLQQSPKGPSVFAVRILQLEEPHGRNLCSLSWARLVSIARVSFCISLGRC